MGNSFQSPGNTPTLEPFWDVILNVKSSQHFRGHIKLARRQGTHPDKLPGLYALSGHPVHRLHQFKMLTNRWLWGSAKKKSNT